MNWLYIPIGLIGAAILLKWLIPTPSDIVSAAFKGFKEELLGVGGNTTTRQSDGVEAYDFRYYPLIEITPDVSGAYTIEWFWQNYLDGNQGGSSDVNIVNIADLTAGQPTTVQLVDNRPGNTRGGSIAFGDPDGLFDGLWHNLRSTITVHVISPSGATVNTAGELNETFKSVSGELKVNFAGFNVEQL